MSVGLEYVGVDNLSEARASQRKSFSNSRHVPSRFIRSSKYNNVESLILGYHENLFDEAGELIPEHALFTIFGRDEFGEPLTVEYAYYKGTPLSTIVTDFENQIAGLIEDYGHISLVDLDVDYYYSW